MQPGSTDAAAAAAVAPYSLPTFTAEQPLSAIEPGLYGLLDHFALPDECCEQLAAALEVLAGSSSGNAAAAAADKAQQKLGRFAGDYAQLRSWAGRGRAAQVHKALQKMLHNALQE
jgi:hypothetical protein